MKGNIPMVLLRIPLGFPWFPSGFSFLFLPLTVALIVLLLKSTTLQVLHILRHAQSNFFDVHGIASQNCCTTAGYLRYSIDASAAASLQNQAWIAASVVTWFLLLFQMVASHSN